MMEIQPEAKSIYLIDLDTSAQYDRKRKTPFVIIYVIVVIKEHVPCRSLWQ